MCAKHKSSFWVKRESQHGFKTGFAEP